ncbi:hypothetical protein B0H66DRAFT_552763 [Apodospora peruviana]|uniref:Tat pathway signal sequence n=1 Tax=Apodospora peruviana TaxID=516989 RepID=A0AAE0IB83_9PEZI|nr:hypothetical protein B0H66DRAFT_552763 [Apodospora peruviana]
MSFKKSVVYSPLSTREDGSSSRSDEDRRLLREDSTAKWQSRRLNLPSCLILANIALFITSTILFLISASLFYKSGGFRPGRNGLLKASSHPSPILDLVDIPLITKRMNGSLLEPSASSDRIIYRQPPSPEVDAAWDRIQTREPIPITREDVIKLGKDPSDAAKFPTSFGDEAYVGKIDVFHQIHCLNTLRMNLRNNFAYYYGDEFPGDKPTDAWHDVHVAHCLNILLENLMCAANVDVYTSFWMDAQLQPFPDFNIDHRCRDFDAILAWQEEHAVPLEEFAKIRRPADAKVHIMSHEFKEVMHWYDERPDDGMQGGETA